MRGMTIRSRPATLLGALLMLAGCAGDRKTGLFSARPQEPAHTGSIRPQVDMSGRWILVSPGRGQCNMNFGGTPEAGEGTIAPEGGCAGNFYTSRKWTFEQGSLVIRDHTGAPLGQLSLAGPSRFEGKATSGQQLILAR